MGSVDPGIASLRGYASSASGVVDSPTSTETIHDGRQSGPLALCPRLRLPIRMPISGRYRPSADCHPQGVTLPMFGRYIRRAIRYRPTMSRGSYYAFGLNIRPDSFIPGNGLRFVSPNSVTFGRHGRVSSIRSAKTSAMCLLTRPSKCSIC